MKNTTLQSGIILVVLLLAACSANAKWWIFGKSGEDIGINYMFINDMTFEEEDTKITIYKDTLIDGMIYIRGKASAKRNKIGAVNITIDGKTTWKAAEVNKDGAFEYKFKPEVNIEYDLYIEVLDTTGKKNKVEDTHKLLFISDRNLLDEAKAILDKMVKAYGDEDAAAFMVHVSPNFSGDDVVLDRAIRKDFTAFDNINLKYTVSSIASDSKGRISVAILYNRSLTSTKNGKSYRDTGTTQLVFEAINGVLKVWSMKNPLIFGLSDASNVSSGTTYLASNTQIIIVDSTGNTAVKPFNEAIKIIEQDNEVTQEKTITLYTTELNKFDGFIFAEEERTSETNSANIIGDIAIVPYGGMSMIHLHAGVTIVPMGVKKLSEVTEAPATGYTGFAHGMAGNSYVIKLANNTYAAFEIISVTGGGGGAGSVLIKYKYQPSGSLVF